MTFYDGYYRNYLDILMQAAVASQLSPEIMIKSFFEIDKAITEIQDVTPSICDVMRVASIMAVNSVLLAYEKDDAFTQNIHEISRLITDVLATRDEFEKKNNVLMSVKFSDMICQKIATVRSRPQDSAVIN